MVVAVHQPLAECIAIYTVCNAKHRQPPVKVTKEKTSIVHQWYEYLNSADTHPHPRSKINALATHQHNDIGEEAIRHVNNIPTMQFRH